MFHPGVQGIVWYLCWLYFAYEEPSDHPNISKAELNHIGKHWNTKVYTCMETYSLFNNQTPDNICKMGTRHESTLEWVGVNTCMGRNVNLQGRQ